MKRSFHTSFSELRSACCFVLLCLLLTQCTPQPGGPDPTSGVDALVVREEILQRYGTIRSIEATRYLELLTTRLGTTVRRSDISIIASEEPFAARIGRFLVVSKGLFRRIPDEGTFGFVIAHEIAHALLGHTSEAEGSSRRDQELAADQKAVELLCRAGFPLDAPLRAVALLHEAESRAHSIDYPSVDERVRRVAHVLFSCRTPNFMQGESWQYRKVRGQVILSSPAS